MHPPKYTLHSNYRMSRTTYRLFDGMTRVSTAVKLTDGSILMVYPRKENFADVNLWKYVVEHEEDYDGSSLTLSTKLATVASSAAALSPGPLSPYTPPLASIQINPFNLGMSIKGTRDDITHTPQISPRAEFQEPLPTTPPAAPHKLGPSASIAPYDPMKLGPTAEANGYDIDDDTLMYIELTHLQSDLAALARTMNDRFILMDIRIKALIQKLD